jgi:hypothetical protein
MKYYDFEKDAMCIPQQISNYALYSGQIFIFGAIVACFLKHYYLSALIFLLYVSTMLFWSNVRTKYLSKEKLFDSFIAASTVLLATFYYARYYFKPQYKTIWCVTIAFSIFVFIINEIVYYFNVNKWKDFGRLVNIAERNVINNMTVFSHILFLHILPVFAYIYCAVSSI